jgi:hypothetical protein
MIPCLPSKAPACRHTHLPLFLSLPSIRPCRFHWPSIYFGSAAPDSEGGGIVQPVYWFVDMLASYNVRAASSSLVCLARHV